MEMFEQSHCLSSYRNDFYRNDFVSKWPNSFDLTPCNSKVGTGNPRFKNPENFSCEIQNLGIFFLWNPEFSSRNLESHKRLKSKIQVPLTRNLNEESISWIQNPRLYLDYLNPLSPNSDQHQISPCNINAL